MVCKQKFYLIFSDLHIPYHHTKICKKIFQAIKDIKPEKIFLLGDIVDFPAISVFNKSPDRFDNLQDEIDEFKETMFEMLQGYSNNVYYLLGNHEQRLKSYLNSRAKPLASLKVLEIDKLLELDKLNITLIKSPEVILFNNLILTHGTRYGVFPAKLNAQLYLNYNGISAHAHKTSVFYYNSFKKSHFWFSIGHLSDQSKLEYAQDMRWDSSFCLITVEDKKYYPRIINIDNKGNFYLHETQKSY